MAEEVKAPVVVVAPVAPRRPRRFPFLATLADEIKKLEYETEEEAKKLLTRDVAAARDDKDDVMRIARGRLADHKGSLQDLRDDLADVRESLTGDNSGDHRPLDETKDDKKEEGEKIATDTSDNSTT